jgi:predicted ArsR family transcriptional regulator
MNKRWKPKYGRNTVIKNSYKVFHLIQEMGTVSAEDIAFILKLSKKQASNYLLALKDTDLMEVTIEFDNKENRPGGPTKFYTFVKLKEVI